MEFVVWVYAAGCVVCRWGDCGVRRGEVGGWEWEVGGGHLGRVRWGMGSSNGVGVSKPSLGMIGWKGWLKGEVWTRWKGMT